MCLSVMVLEQRDVRGQRIGLHDLEVGRALECVERAGRVAQRDVEIVHLHEHARDRRARRRRHRDGDRARSWTPAPRRVRGPVRGNRNRCWRSIGVRRPPMPARLLVAPWQVLHLPSPLKKAAPALASPVRTLPGWKIGDPRSESLTRCRRKCARSTICVVGHATRSPLGEGCPFFRKGPSSLP